MTITGLPARVTATLADEGPDRQRVYRIADERGYTHRRDTIRIGPADMRGRERYAVYAWRKDGWAPLLMGSIPEDEPVPYHEAVHRAVAVLFGVEDHG